MTRAETKMTPRGKRETYAGNSGHPTTGEANSVSLDAGSKAAQAALQVVAEGVITLMPATKRQRPGAAPVDKAAPLLCFW